MDRFHSDVNLRALREELFNAPVARIKDGSGHPGNDHRGGWITGMSNMRIFWSTKHTLIDRFSEYPHVELAVKELSAHSGHHHISQAMVNVLDPGGKLAAHRDGLPDHYRYHLPVQTNEQASWWDEHGGTVHMDQGFWYGPVPYCGVLHAATNHGILARVHLVVDFFKREV